MPASVRPLRKEGTASGYAVGAAPCGRPLERVSPNVGRGLKVNRPKAERSHPGVCSRRCICEFCPGPLRQNRDNLFPNPAEAGTSAQELGYFITFSLRQQDRSLSIAGLFSPSLSFCGPTTRSLFVCLFRPVWSFCGEKRPLSLHTSLCQQYIVSPFFYTSIY